MDRLFLDANVLFSAAYREKTGLSALWTVEKATLCSSTYAVEEAKRNLSDQQQLRRLELLLEDVQIVAVHTVPETLLEGAVLPEKDLPILAGAISANCSHLITGDFRHFGEYFGKHLAGVLVLPPADYLRDASRTI